MTNSPSNITNLIQPEHIEIIKSDGTQSLYDVSLIEESCLNIYLNDKLVTSIPALPKDLCELAVGILFSMNKINSYRQITSITIDENAGNIYVVSSAHLDSNLKSTSLSPVNQIAFDYNRIFKLINSFSEDTPLHIKTSCTHSCFLAGQNTLHTTVEDIGRHNAVDKAIGYALINDINLSECILFTSGRVPHDLVVKVINAGIPILVSKSMPTKKAVALAQKYKLTLLCHARNDSFYKFS